ncbi:hypothetical protein PP459_gp199 [Streptomyces phage Wakanda]|uniref:Uncharacterized protein n=1 Tax=Streptomyces phage Wakanda TaxID=2713267 RepID=A0A6G8R1F4_9CAUD|nr:hypothetical protein PP459_gp199 [Streptomyces phage Wakanda]QIN94035.1 hypothetical protein SEA_WAKANDA_42 [Streptomyces phage Wakanda]
MFRRQTKSLPANPAVPTTPTNYPYGLCIQTEAGYFLMREKFRFRIPTERVLESWNFKVIPSSELAVKHIKVGGKIGFRDGTIIHNMADGKHYLISQNKRRHIIDPDVWERYGLDWGDVILVSENEANLHSDGEVLK